MRKPTKQNMLWDLYHDCDSYQMFEPLCWDTCTESPTVQGGYQSGLATVVLSHNVLGAIVLGKEKRSGITVIEKTCVEA